MVREVASDRSAFPDEDAARTDLIFEVLADRQRRIVLAHLSEHDDADRPELAELLAARIDGISPPVAAARLHHAHLPKLEQAGLIEYDRETVRLSDQYDQLALLRSVLG